MTTIDFFSNGTFQGSVYNLNGVTITGSNDVVDSDNGPGLGIAGGASVFGPATVDAGETIVFSFDTGAATDVSFSLGAGYNFGGDIEIETVVEAFGIDGNSLGTLTVGLFPALNLNVTQLFGGVAISQFQLTAAFNDGFAIGGLTFTPTSPNQPPNASPDSVSTAQNTAINIPVTTLLANDTDANGDSLIITGVSNATGGTVSLINGNVLFTPANDFTGNANFNYTLSDGEATSIGNVTVNVTPVAGINRGGKNGRDNILGGLGKDTLSGGNGDDIINGGAGSDIIRGDNGNDTLIGGTGNDTVTGGRGADRFVISNNSGQDTFTDFSVSQGDRIGLSGGLQFGQLTFSGNQISFGTTVLATLNGVNTSTLTASNFVSI